MTKYCIAVVAVLALAVGSCHAAIPGRISYQGKLTDSSGKLVADGSYSMTFKLFDALTGGTEKWSETHAGDVVVTNGMFNVMLGCSPTCLSSVFQANDSLYLEITIGAETLAPRQEMASAGYAFRAEKVADGAITAASLGDGAVTAAKIAGSAVTNDAVSGTAGISWSKVDKTASSLADLGTRSASDLSSGSLSAARLPAGGAWTLESALGVTGANIGIGTTNPAAKLDVSGDLQIADAGDIRFASGAKIERNNGAVRIAPESGREVEFAGQWKSLVQPCCRVHRAGSPQSITNTGWNKILMNAEGFDLSNEFDPSASRFTAGTAGYYFIHVNVQMEMPNEGDMITLAIVKSGDYVSTHIVRVAPNTRTDTISASCSDIVYLNGSTDYIEFHIWQNSGNARNLKQNDNVTYAVIFRLC